MMEPKTCLDYTIAMNKIRKQCNEERLVPLYHYTSQAVSKLIFDYGFRMSTQGQGDGGVYFSTLGPASYGLGYKSYEDNIIKDCFGEERLEEYKGQHKLDVVFVYGINPLIIEAAPGGRAHAKMVTKSMFEDFATTSISSSSNHHNHNDGNYYLRPDRIKGCFLIDGTTKYPSGKENAKSDLLRERINDREIFQILHNFQNELKINSEETKSYRRMFQSLMSLSYQNLRITSQEILTSPKKSKHLKSYSHHSTSSTPTPPPTSGMSRTFKKYFSNTSSIEEGGDFTLDDVSDLHDGSMEDFEDFDFDVDSFDALHGIGQPQHTISSRMGNRFRNMRRGSHQQQRRGDGGVSESSSHVTIYDRIFGPRAPVLPPPLPPKIIPKPQQRIAAPKTRQDIELGNIRWKP